MKSKNWELESRWATDDKPTIYVRCENIEKNPTPIKSIIFVGHHYQDLRLLMSFTSPEEKDKYNFPILKGVEVKELSSICTQFIFNKTNIVA